MEYVQMTLDEWVQMKRQLKEELQGVTKGFVRIGYTLRRMSDEKLYERDGYKTMAEFARVEYGLGADTVSRFMKINKMFSEDGYSQRLDAKFANMGRSQLEEMLTLPESDYQMIQQNTAREDIRELKRFNKTEPQSGIADDIRQLTEAFYEVNKDILNEVFSEPSFEEENIKKFAEIVNPGGSRSFKKGLFFMMMYENRITVKKFGADPKDLSWWEFWQITKDIFGEAAAGAETWRQYFGEEEIAPAQKSEKKKEKEAQKTVEKAEPKEKPEEKPKAETKEELEEKPKEEPKVEIKEEPEEKTEPEEEQEEIKPEVAAGHEEIQGEPEVAKAYNSRLAYMAARGATEAGEYMANTMNDKIRQMRNVSFSVLATKTFWEEFFEAEVDEKGREIECV